MGNISIFIHYKRLFFVISLILCLIISIEPVVFVFTPFHDIFRVGQVAVLVFGVVFCYLNNGNIKFPIYLTIYFSYLVVVTYINHGAIIKVITTLLPIIGLVFALEYFFKKNIFLTMKTMYIYFSILVYINFIFMIIRPDGLITVTTTNTVVGYNFLGVSNQLGPYLILASVISLIYASIRKRITINIVLVNVCAYISLILVWSATSIAWFTIYFVLLIFMSKKSILSNFINWLNVLVFIIISHLLIVFVKAQNWFDFIIVDILNKDLTLSGRTVIWDEAIKLIKGSLIFGYGEISDGRYIRVGSALFNTHNIFLQLFLQGGILFVLFTLLIMFTSLYQIKQNQNQSVNSILLISVLTLFCMMITEVYAFIIIFILLFLVYHCYLYIPSDGREGKVLTMGNDK